MDEAGAHPLILHASCVAYRGSAVLVLGQSGRGKSGLCLELMARGARLVSDDRVILKPVGAALVASAPAAISGQIEARYVGILNADPVGPTFVELVIDLDTVEQDRLPPRRSKILLGKSLPLLHYADTPFFPVAILQYLRAGRRD